MVTPGWPIVLDMYSLRPIPALANRDLVISSSEDDDFYDAEDDNSIAEEEEDEEEEVVAAKANSPTPVRRSSDLGNPRGNTLLRALSRVLSYLGY